MNVTVSDPRSIAAHCERTAFVFVPNLCNAACEFCYVQPKFAQTARASSVTLHRAAMAADALALLGFRSVRLTGGEPTLFTNLDQIIKPFIDNGLNYRVLTNGLDLSACMEFFSTNPPERVTLSVHDTTHPERVFGVVTSSAKLSATRKYLAGICPVEATIVIDANGTWDGVESTLSDLSQDGVRHIKIILENSRQVSDAMAFDERAHLLLESDWPTRFDSLRVTDTSQRSCRLKNKGFPALDLGRWQGFSCCVQVGDRPSATGYSASLGSSAVDCAESLVAIINTARTLEPAGLPCAAGSLFCPLALQ